ncbi:hypothetical protein AB0937_38355 [Streptomyces sp. NPDC047880]|uniref:hypothetical protein n=1 Tax=unclassified Streptomyces TaxID=2593676 RepID=UPI0013C0B480|nr:hypothetical protein [Streptomyces sp. SID8111]NEB59287.1 hypothetical protein [Streptomyces diastaticus]NEB62000.1 hypothetical protein [Streptomyces diastaticus]NEC29217.1 hypothetical protein [Streptomyces sp. SID8111]
MQDTPETTGERLTRTLAHHGLAVRTLVSRRYDGSRIVVDVEGGAEIRIADQRGLIDGRADWHCGWIARYRPHGARSGEGETRIYESSGARLPFEQDTAALVVAVVQCATARSLAVA